MKFKAATSGTDATNVLVHAAIVAAAAVLTYATQHFTASDFGAYGPVIMAGISITLQFLQSSIKTN